MLLMPQIILHVSGRIIIGRTIIDDKIRDEKLQHSINREAAKISALSFKKNDKYKYLAGKDSSWSKKSYRTSKVYSSFGKPLEKQTKTINEQEKNKSKL